MDQAQGPPTFLSGRTFSAQEIQEIQETVRVFYRLSWYELLQTICEHLTWVTATGQYKVASCEKALKNLETLGLVKLPVKHEFVGRRQRIGVGARTDPGAELSGRLKDIEPIELEPVRSREAMGLWNEYVERYHPLAYKRPFGAHQRYFILARSGNRVGCLLFAASAWALAARDEWIGWSETDRAQRLNLVVNNTRFLIFPWVWVRNLASKALSLAAGRI